jgi:hypothetical protein
MLNGRMTDELEKVLKEKRLWPDEDNILTNLILFIPGPSH